MDKAQQLTSGEHANTGPWEERSEDLEGEMATQWTEGVRGPKGGGEDDNVAWVGGIVTAPSRPSGGLSASLSEGSGSLRVLCVQTVQVLGEGGGVAA